jgi:holo-ACP synthase/holo-ACP synthase/triphosphoribosyl-dephospho-CoA synthase
MFISAEADATEVKRRMCMLEDRDRLGRIFDIDVLRVDGSKVSREDFGMAPRKCLMCEQEAHLCARNRTHKVADMVEEIHRIIQNARGEA